MTMREGSTRRNVTYGGRDVQHARAVADLGTRGDVYERAYVRHKCEREGATFLWVWKRATLPIRTEHGHENIAPRTRAAEESRTVTRDSYWMRATAHAWRARQYAREGVGL